MIIVSCNFHVTHTFLEALDALFAIRKTVGEVSGEAPKKIKWWFTPHTKECSSTCHELLSFNHAINNVHKLKCTNVHLNRTDNSSEHKLPNLK